MAISCQATDRHSQEAGEENYVGKKREIENVSGKPTNASQLEKQNNEAYENQLESVTETRIFLGRRNRFRSPYVRTDGFTHNIANYPLPIADCRLLGSESIN